MLTFCYYVTTYNFIIFIRNNIFESDIQDPDWNAPDKTLWKHHFVMKCQALFCWKTTQITLSNLIKFESENMIKFWSKFSRLICKWNVSPVLINGISRKEKRQFQSIPIEGTHILQWLKHASVKIHKCRCAFIHQ